MPKTNTKTVIKITYGRRTRGNNLKVEGTRYVRDNDAAEGEEFVFDGSAEANTADWPGERDFAQSMLTPEHGEAIVVSDLPPYIVRAE